MGNVLCSQVQKSVCASWLGVVSRGIPGVLPFSSDGLKGRWKCWGCVLSVLLSHHPGFVRVFSELWSSSSPAPSALCDQTGTFPHPSDSSKPPRARWDGKHGSYYSKITSLPILKFSKQFPGVIHSSQGGVCQGRLCSDQGQSSSHLVCHWEIFPVSFTGTWHREHSARSNNRTVMQVNRSSCGWALKHLALLFCLPDSFIAVNTPRGQFNKLNTIKRFFFMVLRGLICNSWLHSLWKL